MGGNVQSDKEKRRVERKNLVFYLRVYEEEKAEVLGHIVNLSSRGVMVFSKRAIPVDRSFSLKMRSALEVGEGEGLRVEATSCWCRQDSDPDYFLSGFRFDGLTPLDRKQLLKVLHGLRYTAFAGMD